MGDILERIANAVGEVVGRVNLPLVAGTEVVVLLDNAVGSKIPKLRVALVGIREALLHAQVSLTWLVLSVAHSPEFGQGLVGGPVAVGACEAFSALLSPLALDLLSCTNCK